MGEVGATAAVALEGARGNSGNIGVVVAAAFEEEEEEAVVVVVIVLVIAISGNKEAAASGVITTAAIELPCIIALDDATGVVGFSIAALLFVVFVLFSSLSSSTRRILLELPPLLWTLSSGGGGVSVAVAVSMFVYVWTLDQNDVYVMFVSLL